jgi:3-oxo-5-alpha-steroid 4-dehydrogenase
MSSANLAIICVAVQSVLAAVLVVGEVSGRLRLPYSKFGTGVGVNSQTGLALAYTTPIIIYVAFWIEGGAPQSPYHLVVLGTFLFHFIRRILEILFVSTYSRPTSLRALVPIALLYGGAAASSAFFQVHTSAQPTSSPTFVLGTVVFGLGELLNGYHHWLLGRLRLQGVHTYVAPHGGLFGWVASPHYFGEILSFVGYAMMSDLLPVWGNALVVFAYLSARANSTLKWYQGEMPLRIPAGWRRLVPFVY